MGGYNRYSSGAAFPDMSPTINNFADNLVRLKMHQDEVDFRAQQMEAERPFKEAQLAEQQMKVQEMQKVQAERQKPIDLTVHPMFLSMPEETRPQMLEFFAKQGLTDERGVGTQESFERGIKTIESSAPLFKSFMEPVVEIKKNDVIKAYDAVIKAQESGDQKKMQTAQAEFEKKNMAYQTARGNLDKHLEGLAKHQQAMELEGVKNEGRMDVLNTRLDMQEKLQDERLRNQRDLRLMGAARGGNRRPTEYEEYLDQFEADKASGAYGANSSNRKPLTRYEYNLWKKGKYKAPYGLNPKGGSKSGGLEDLQAELTGGGQRQQLDQNTAMKFLKQAGGDKNKARQLAKQAGYSF